MANSSNRDWSLANDSNGGWGEGEDVGDPWVCEDVSTPVEEVVEDFFEDLPDLLPWAMTATRVRDLLANKVRSLGFGSFGKCYLVDLEDGSPAVLKVLHKTVSAKSAAELVREFRMLVYLDGAGGAPKPLGICRAKRAVLMASVGRESLKDFLARRFRDTAACRKLSQNLCARMHELRAKAVVHRDLKPDNIMVDDSLGVYLIDFGLAFRMDLEGETPRPMRLAVHARRETMAAKGWIAPEVLQGATPTFQSDAYSLGYVLTKIWNASEVENAFHEIHLDPLPEHIHAIIDSLLEHSTEFRRAVPKEEEW